MPSTELGVRSLEELGLELLTVGAVVDPAARRSDPLASRNGGSVADQGDEFAMATGFDANDAKAVVSVLVGDALD